MTNSLINLFALDEKLSYLNHASYGAPTINILRKSQELRLEIERDTAVSLSKLLVPNLEQIASKLQEHVKFDQGELALVPNATFANNALASSMGLKNGQAVAMFDCEYSSVIKCWQYYAKNAGAECILLPFHLPASRAKVLESLQTLPETTRILVISAVTSSTALAMPIRDIAKFCEARGIELIIDAAQVIGHMDSLVDFSSATAVFGSLHKWLPSPRAAGFLWVNTKYSDQIRSSNISLSWDKPTLLERFSWWGTWDPVSCLMTSEGLHTLYEWQSMGYVAKAEELANYAFGAIESLGLKTTSENDMSPLRLRAFRLGDRNSVELKKYLYGKGLRVWVGKDYHHETLLRVSINIYNDKNDINKLLSALDAVL